MHTLGTSCACEPVERTYLKGHRPPGSLVSTPLQTEAWEQAISFHPDSVYQHYIIDSLSKGFCIGFDRRQPVQSVRNNMPSAAQHHSVGTEYVTNESKLGCFHGPLSKPQPGVHINQLGVILKGHTADKWHLITGLSLAV